MVVKLYRKRAVPGPMADIAWWRVRGVCTSGVRMGCVHVGCVCRCRMCTGKSLYVCVESGSP